MSLRRCSQCWREKGPRSFQGPDGRSRRQCNECRARYASWSKKTTAEKLAGAPERVPSSGPLRARLYLRSGNKKLGGIPASVTSRGTCPPSCALYRLGCYALHGKLGFHWRNVGRDGQTWESFCADVAALPEGQLWRHNEAGDLPGVGETIDAVALDRLVAANRGRHGFTFTHKHQLLANHVAIARANASGFTVNLSADSLEDADGLAALDIGPVAVVVDEAAPVRLRTPGGRRVTVCPAQTVGATCADCQLCSLPNRHAIVAFRAHGQARRLVPELVQLRRRVAEASP